MIKKIITILAGTKKPYIHNNVTWLNTAGYINY